MSDTQQTMDFWQDHSDNYLKMALNHERRERPERPDGYGKKTGQCGDTIEFFLTVENGQISHISLDIDGCMHTSATANAVATLSEGKQLETAWDIHPETVAEYLETLPEDHFHCAELAVGAFYLALADIERKAAGTPID
ncbi:iron-sulfur cluster assembly scaffold protein [Desulfoplanes sp.]